MNVKKRLENRIRGWFPQEPKFLEVPAKTDFQIKPQPIIPSQISKSTVRTAKVIGISSGISIVILILFISSLINGETAWITATGLVSGLVFGLISAFWVTPRVLKRAENHKDSLGWKEYLGVTVPAIIVYLSFIQVSSVFSWTYFFVWVVTFWFVQMVLFLVYERKKKVFIVQNGWFGVVYSLVPQAIKNSSAISPEDSHPKVTGLIPDRKSWFLFLNVGTFVIIIPVFILWLSSYTNFFNSGEWSFIVFLSFAIGALFALLFSMHYLQQRKKTVSPEIFHLSSSVKAILFFIQLLSQSKQT